MRAVCGVGRTGIANLNLLIWHLHDAVSTGRRVNVITFADCSLLMLLTCEGFAL